MKSSEASKPRERILETADRLFYREGVRAVGIDRIIAEAGVAKMSLYGHFASKDDLILEVLKLRERRVFDWFAEASERHLKRTKDPVKAFFGALKEWFDGAEFRGCAFINASVELADPRHAGFQFAVAHKERFGALLAEILQQVAGKRASRLAPAVDLLVQGAIVNAVLHHSSAPADVALDATLKLLQKDPTP